MPTPISWSPPEAPLVWTAGRGGEPRRPTLPTAPSRPAGLSLKQPLTPATSPANKTPPDWSLLAGDNHTPDTLPEPDNEDRGLTGRAGVWGLA